MINLNPLKLFKKSYSLNDPRLTELFGHTPTISGINVGPQSALHVPAVNAAVRVISESVASLPLNILSDDGTSKAVDKKDLRYRLVHYEPNGWTSSYDLRQQVQADVLLYGNGYIFINRVGGAVRELIRLLPTSVAVKIDQFTSEPIYTISDAAGGARTVPYTDIIHVRALTGVAPIVQAREAIALALALEAHVARLMSNAGRPSGLLSVKGKLDKDARERLKAAWNNSHSGPNAGGTAVFDQEVDFTQLTFNSVDMQFTENRRFQLDEISRAFRVPPHLLSELGRVTWANAAELGQNFLDYTLMPWLIQWQGAMNRTLFTPEERLTKSVEFDTSALTRANLQVRTDSYSKAVGGPWMTANEARALENRPPITGADVLNEPMSVAASDNQPSEQQDQAA